MIRVLVVDDDFMVAKVQCGFVGRVPGFTVAGVAHSGAEALAEVDRLRPDLVLLDIYLPDVSGLEVLRQAAGGRRGGGRTRGDRGPGRQHHPDRVAQWCGLHYLIKPFSFDALRDRLERYAVAHQGSPAPPRWSRTTSTGSSLALRPTPIDLPKGLTRPTADLVRRRCGRPTETCRRPSAPTGSGCPGSAPAVTWSISSVQARPG